MKKTDPPQIRLQITIIYVLTITKNQLLIEMYNCKN